MKLDKETFEKVMGALRGVDGLIYDNNARLFCGGKGTKFPAFEEEIKGVLCSYILYANVFTKTLPLEHGMNYSLIDKSRVLEVPRDTNMPCAYASGLATHFDKPLEVIAREIPGNSDKIRPKWDLWMVRDVGEQEGYIHDDVARFLTQR